MKNFIIPTKDQVDDKGKAIFDQLEKSIGKVPNLYATIGHSSNALEAYLQFQQAQAKGSFNAKEREAVNLAVSQANACQYCLAAHTTIAKMNGFTEEETLQLRAGTIEDAKLRAITRLSAAIVHSHGKPAQEELDAFFEQGYNEKALMDLVSLVADKSLSNYVHNITQVAIDFPEAKPLEQEVY